MPPLMTLPPPPSAPPGGKLAVATAVAGEPMTSLSTTDDASASVSVKSSPWLTAVTSHAVRSLNGWPRSPQPPNTRKKALGGAVPAALPVCAGDEPPPVARRPLRPPTPTLLGPLLVLASPPPPPAPPLPPLMTLPAAAPRRPPAPGTARPGGGPRGALTALERVTEGGGAMVPISVPPDSTEARSHPNTSASARLSPPSAPTVRRPHDGAAVLPSTDAAEGTGACSAIRRIAASTPPSPPSLPPAAPPELPSPPTLPAAPTVAAAAAARPPAPMEEGRVARVSGDRLIMTERCQKRGAGACDWCSAVDAVTSVSMTYSEHDSSDAVTLPPNTMMCALPGTASAVCPTSGGRPLPAMSGLLHVHVGSDSTHMSRRMSVPL